MRRHLPDLVPALVLVTLTACDTGPQSPEVDERTTAIRLAASFQDTCEGDEAAYDAANGVWIRLTAPGMEPLFDEVVPFDPSAQQTSVEIEVELTRETAVLLETEIRRGQDALFRGSTDVTLTPGRAETITLTLVSVPAGIEIPGSLGPLVSIGETALLEGSVLFATGDEACGLALSWRSLDPQVATVVTSGGAPAVRAVNDGVARIEASHAGFTEILTVAVGLEVVSVEVEPRSATVDVGSTLQLSAVARDALGNAIPNRTPTWSSNNLSVATVTTNGLVRGRGVGTATITATLEGLQDAATVQVVATAPAATTFEAIGVGARSATVQGVVNPRGAATDVRFEWATNPTLDGAESTESMSVGSGTLDVPVSAELTGLAPATPHYFRVVATNSVGTTRGAIRRFDTEAQPVPTVVTQAATEVTAAQATLNGLVNPEGVETERWFEWSTDPDLGDASSSDTVSVGAGVEDVAVSFQVTGLSPETTYYFRAFAANEAGTGMGQILSFETGVQPPPSVLTLLPAGITTTTAILQGAVNPNGAETDAWFEWATNATLDDAFSTAPQSVGSGTVDVIHTANVIELAPETQYWVRVLAENVADTTRGAILAFRTAIPAPSNLSVDQSGITNFVGWQDNSTTEESFRIERSTTSATSGFTTVGTADQDVEIFADSPLPSGTVWYRVRACDADQCWAPSPAVSVVVPAPVIQGTVRSCFDGCFALTGYLVTLNPGGDTALTDANGFYQFTGLTAGSFTVSVADGSCATVPVDFTPNSRQVTLVGGGHVVAANFDGDGILCAAGGGG